MAQWHRKPVFLAGTTVDTSAAFTSTAFASGDIGFFTVAGVNTGAALAVAESPFFVAAKGTDATKFTRRSTPINYKNITRLAKKAYTAPVAQITYTGYNPVAGTGGLEYKCDTDYGIKLIAYSPYIHKFYNNRGLEHTYHIHTECCADDCENGCSASDCFAETAKFVETINNVTDSGNQMHKFVYAELVMDGVASDTVTADAGSGTVTIADGTATFTNGSKTVTFSVNQTIPTGTYLRISTDGVDPPAATAPVYLVATGVTAGTTITLDTPWQGATSAIIVTDSTIADSEVTAVVTSAVTACGIKWTGRFIDTYTGCCCFPPFPWDFEGVTFDIVDSLEASFPCSTLSTTTTDMAYGNGTGKELIYREMDALGYSDLREFFRACEMNGNDYQSMLTAATNYDVWYIEYSHSFPTTAMGGDYDRTDYIVTIAMPTTTGGALDTFFTSAASLAGIAVT